VKTAAADKMVRFTIVPRKIARCKYPRRYQDYGASG
jgi:hypothetical protein